MTTGDPKSPRGKFEFPECWSNDVRMNSLFAPFRSKSLNPTDWDSKMKFWVNLIEKWCQGNKCPIIEITSLKNSFCRKGLVPACLDEVLLHMKSTGILIMKDNFMAMDDSWRTWAVKVLMTNPLKWTFDAVKSTIIKEPGKKEVCYVHLPVIKNLSEELVRNASALKRKIVNYEDLLNSGIDDAEHLSLILYWLQKQGLVVVHQESDQTLVKFLKSGVKQEKITEVDLGIYNLERQQNLLEDNIKKLESERNAAVEEAKRHLAAKMKNMAKLSLRRKQNIEKTIEKQAVVLENIQGILHKIDQAMLDSEVVHSYQTGIATLKAIFKETGLNAENVTGTLKELECVLNSRKEIDEALSKPLDPSMEESLEEELNNLLLQDAPEVPEDDFPIVVEVQEKKKKEGSKDALESRMEALSI